MADPHEDATVNIDGAYPQEWREVLSDPAEALRRRVHSDDLVVGNIDYVPTDESEDWTKAGSWDFHRGDGTPIDTLEELEAVLGHSADSSVAEDLLRLPFGKAAPAKLIEEARRRVG